MPKSIVEYIVKSLVEKPEQVRIVEKKEDSRIVLEIHVDKDDLGKVIGRAGKTIRSIRTVVSLLQSEIATGADQDILIEVAR